MCELQACTGRGVCILIMCVMWGVLSKGAGVAMHVPAGVCAPCLCVMYVGLHVKEGTVYHVCCKCVCTQITYYMHVLVGLTLCGCQHMDEL